MPSEREKMLNILEEKDFSTGKIDGTPVVGYKPKTTMKWLETAAEKENGEILRFSELVGEVVLEAADAANNDSPVSERQTAIEVVDPITDEKVVKDMGSYPRRYLKNLISIWREKEKIDEEKVFEAKYDAQRDKLEADEKVAAGLKDELMRYRERKT